MIPGLLNLLGFGRVSLVDDRGDMQELQVTQGARGTGMDDRVLPRVRHAQPFGLAASPPPGSAVVLVALGGERSKSIAISAAHQPSRPRDLGEGDVVLYDERGRMVRLTTDGIVVDGAGGPVTIRNAIKVRCECDVETTGDVIARADGARVSLGKLHDAYQVHVHPPKTVGAAWGSGPPMPKA